MCKSKIAACTDIGPRDNIEDAYSALRLSWPFSNEKANVVIGIVCDGVGGNCCGEIASVIATDLIISQLATIFAAGRPDGQHSPFAPDDVLDALNQSLRIANDGVLRQATIEPRMQGMSTTAVCAAIIENVLYVGWVGDSRCYVCRGNRLKQITHDHSEIQKLVDAGLIDEQQAKRHPLSHIINRSIGQEEDFLPETNTCRLSKGDIVLLSSDGLTDVVSDDEIVQAIEACRHGEFAFDELPKQLTCRALANGTTDNVTVLCYEHSATSMPSDRTRTGTYSLAAAKAIQTLNQEKENE